jgi:hypothetical protein
MLFHAVSNKPAGRQPITAKKDQLDKACNPELLTLSSKNNQS